MRRELAPLYLAIAGVLGIALTAGIYASQPESHVVNGMPAIERCVNDDFNDGSQDLCWSEGPEGVFVIDKDDHIVSTDLEPDLTVAPCSAWADEANPTFDGPIVPNVCATDDGDVVPAM